jgi:hypothetical protein
MQREGQRDRIAESRHELMYLERSKELSGTSIVANLPNVNVGLELPESERLMKPTTDRPRARGCRQACAKLLTRIQQKGRRENRPDSIARDNIGINKRVIRNGKNGRQHHEWHAGNWDAAVGVSQPIWDARMEGVAHEKEERMIENEARSEGREEVTRPGTRPH